MYVPTDLCLSISVSTLIPARPVAQASYRPLLFYLITEAVAAWSHAKLTRGQGYRLAATTDVAAFYVKRQNLTRPEEHSLPPLVFLHGIGLGLAPYTGFLDGLAKQHPGRPVIAVQFKHVSMRLTTKIPSVVEIADGVAAFLKSQVG